MAGGCDQRVEGVWLNSIIYLAAMSAIDPALYEAADMDGAGRFAKMWHIALLASAAPFMVLLIMNIGHLLEAGFEIQYLMGQNVVMDWSQTIDIFALKYGITRGQYSRAIAAHFQKRGVHCTDDQRQLHRQAPWRRYLVVRRISHV